MNYCTKCGKQNPDTAKFCTGCGAALSVTMSQPTQPVLSLKKKSNNRWILIGAIILAMLLAGSYFIFFNKAGKKSPGSTTNTVVTDAEAETLKELVRQWSASLNKGNAADVASLYAERLVYYHSQMSKGNATVLLSNFFLKNPVFHQEITSEITLEKINSNLIVCKFQKTVTMNGKTTDYPSYLKFSQEMGDWKISEEGDKITDYNLGKDK